MIDKKTATIYILTFIILLSLVFGQYRVDSKIEYTKTLKKEYDKQLSTIKSQLKESESSRQRLLEDVAILRNSYSDLRNQDSLKSLELDSIRGMFDHLTPSQLQKIMTEEYERFKKLQNRQ